MNAILKALFGDLRTVMAAVAAVAAAWLAVRVTAAQGVHAVWLLPVLLLGCVRWLARPR